MMIVLRNGDVEVTIEAEGDYAPDVMHDLCRRAQELFTYQHVMFAALPQGDDEGDE